MAGYEGGSFGGGIDAWLARLGKLRNVVRQELVARQLARHLPPPPVTVLDVGAGQGTQALRLAERGDRVLAVEPDREMRAAFDLALGELPADAIARVVLVEGAIGRLDQVTAGATFDVVSCQGVLMYLDNATPAVAELAAAVAPGGLLSIVVRNADGMALRPGLRRDWDGVQRMLDAAEQDRRYRNEIGVEARADRVSELSDLMCSHGLTVEAWYGVRVLTDGVDPETPVPDDPAELAALLDAEDRVGRTDPYRRVGTLFHLISRRPDSGPGAHREPERTAERQRAEGLPRTRGAPAQEQR